LGAFDFVSKPLDLAGLRKLVSAAIKMSGGRDGETTVFEPRLLGRSNAMQHLREMIGRVARSQAPVHISGESGTGKELVARALHDYGKRRSGPFVAINMAAIPRELIESELFGHERGAFTGATTRTQGRFEQANGGTLFLDEIGDMPPEAQTRLLRVLQEGEFTSVGGRQPIKANVRIIAATHRDLRNAIRQGQFREDLYYRLNVVPIRLPPLRERLDDIPELANHYLRMATADGLPSKVLSPEAMARLKQHRWPGNVRELVNLVRRLSALYSEEVIGVETIEAELADAVSAIEQAPQMGDVANSDVSLADAVDRHLQALFVAHGERLPPDGMYDRVISEVERPLLSLALGATRGNQLRAARLLGLNRNTLRKKIKDLDVPVVRTPQVRRGG
jgi:two-component system nitrogen regulation response regulator GlnG